MFIPGPVAVSHEVLAAQARPLIDHRGPEFSELLQNIGRRLRPIFGTTQEAVLLGSSGTGGLEAAITNLFSPGDKLLACPVGVFGQRLIRIARAFGCDVQELETTSGDALDRHRLADVLHSDANRAIRGILLTHNETSTGVQNDMAAISAAIGTHPALRLIDAVSGLGASEFKMDAWGYDVVVSASQKVLAAPPGLSMIAVSQRAWTSMQNSAAPRFYFDLRKAREFAQNGQTPWTPPVSILFALHAALARYEEQGDINVWRRHEGYARAIAAAARSMGLQLFSRPGAHSRTVVAIAIPETVDAQKLLQTLRERWGVILSAGQQELRGKIIRMGTMGDLSPGDIIAGLAALESALWEQRRETKIGMGVAAAVQAFSEIQNATRDAVPKSDAPVDAQTTAAFR
ncbi:MAG: alanine--glyoxylate aminotransferase family protein [Candidatus Eremiobacteraeota bacterium]|nr:alanine--glyoxylate aminotransferase family protein [Candidatus Eremiobacteraeota bacterium]